LQDFVPLVHGSPTRSEHSGVMLEAPAALFSSANHPLLTVPLWEKVPADFEGSFSKMKPS
jgi:hypothetical protein